MEVLEGLREGLEKEAVIIVHDKIQVALLEKDFVVLGIVGGSSVPHIFQLLKKEKSIDWTKVHIFMLDERKVPLDDELSNFKMAHELFLDNLPYENVHPYQFDLHTLGDYADELMKYSKEGMFDIILVSSGEDGHIASLFPNHDSIKKDSEMFINVHDAPLNPPERMSASRRLIGRSKTAILIFFGEKKKKAFEKFIKDDGEIEKCPAKLIKSIKDSYVLVDVSGEEKL